MISYGTDVVKIFTQVMFIGFILVVISAPLLQMAGDGGYVGKGIFTLLMLCLYVNAHHISKTIEKNKSIVTEFSPTTIEDELCNGMDPPIVEVGIFNNGAHLFLCI